MEVGRWREGVLCEGAMCEEEEGEGGMCEDGEVGEGVERGGGEADERGVEEAEREDCVSAVEPCLVLGSGSLF